MESLLATLRSHPAPICLVRGDAFEIFFANAAFQTLLGYGEDDVCRLSLNDCLTGATPVTLETITAQVTHCVAQPLVTCDANGVERPMEATYKVLGRGQRRCYLVNLRPREQAMTEPEAGAAKPASRASTLGRRLAVLDMLVADLVAVLWDRHPHPMERLMAEARQDTQLQGARTVSSAEHVREKLSSIFRERERKLARRR